MSVSVLILTLDEEANLGACLDSVAFCDDIVVLDSGSTDRTAAIAAERSVRVVVRPFDNYAAQRNFGLNDIPWRHDWILMLDADERVPPDLAAELVARTQSAEADVTMMRMRRKDFLFGTWIRGSGGYPTWFARLARRGKVWVERPINEEYCTSGRTAELAGHLHHYPFNKGLAAWIDKHNRYSSMEARLAFERGGQRWPALGALASRNPLERRKAAKQVLYRLPCRPLVVFLWLYLGRGGFLEGRAGYTFARLRAWYEWLIDLKRRELERAARRPD